MIIYQYIALSINITLIYNSIYLFIYLSRLLWLRDNKSEVWDLINILMDHLEIDKQITKTKENYPIN